MFRIEVYGIRIDGSRFATDPNKRSSQLPVSCVDTHATHRDIHVAACRTLRKWRQNFFACGNPPCSAADGGRNNIYSNNFVLDGMPNTKAGGYVAFIPPMDS